MRKRLRFFLVVLFLGVLAPGRVFARKAETGFLDRQVLLQGAVYKYQVFVPEDWTPKKKWPVILFLHGAGERGDDGLVQTEVGIGTAIRRYRSRFPGVIVMPQCRKDAWWTDATMEGVALAALAQAQKEFHGDPQRIYLTGLSMGGYGTWALAAAYPGKFAALAPICGGVLRPEEARKQPDDDRKPYAETAQKAGKTPVWIFHGGDDPVVPVTESRRMADAMKALGGEVRYFEYPGVNHNSWEKAYAEAELMTWMLSKSLGGKSAK